MLSWKQQLNTTTSAFQVLATLPSRQNKGADSILLDDLVALF